MEENLDLETIELIMAVEEEFIIEIPDDRARRIASIGELRNVVMTELQRFDRRREADVVLDRISEIAANFAHVDRAGIGPDTTLAEDLGLN
jgi:acyl carrier protein